MVTPITEQVKAKPHRPLKRPQPYRQMLRRARAMQLHEQLRPTTCAEVVGQDKILARIWPAARGKRLATRATAKRHRA